MSRSQTRDRRATREFTRSLQQWCRR